MTIREIIISEINKKGKINISEFMEFCLYGMHGYYMNKIPIGVKNDFTTSPEISQMFGEILSLFIINYWKEKINTEFNLIELGPGKGTLIYDILSTAVIDENFTKNINLTLIEKNIELIKLQKKAINKANFTRAIWEQNFKVKKSNIPSIIYSNEFFDCFPVRQFIYKKSWFEKFVSFNENNNSFYFSEKLVNKKDLLILLNLYKKEKILEVSFERNKYFEKICNFIKNNGGLFFTIDYGYLKNNNNFTLQAIQNHKFSNVLENVGDKDISSHVNFNDLISIAEKYKLNIDEFCTQRQFLIKFGILERMRNLSKNNNNKKIKSDLEKLTNAQEMGNLFKCLIVSNL